MKNKRYILSAILCMACMAMTAQSLTEATALYNKGEYEKALPAFQKLVKSAPNNGIYNMRYGVCCLKTGNTKDAVKYLEIAVKRRATGAQLSLAQAYQANYQYEDAIDTYEEYMEELEKKKRSTEEIEKAIDTCRENLRMLKGVEQVCFIDSVVVDKANFLSHYKVSPESGSLHMYNAFFKKSGQQGTVYETELKNKIYYAEQQGDTYRILTASKASDGWTEGTALPDFIGNGANANYPYVMPDGMTIYYASDGEKSMGGYDIFVTRYNSDNNSYLEPGNVGMPFNSTANDYMYVVDEYNNLGWFATDRNQPEGKVCIYVFIPNATKKVYNYESMDTDKLVSLANLRSIKDTWTDQAAVKEAKQRLQAMTTNKPSEQKKREFEFVVDDSHVYYQLADFKSAQAKAAYATYAKLKKSYDTQSEQLDELRTQYAKADQNGKKKLSTNILAIEKALPDLYARMNETALQIRTQEIQKLK